MGRRIGSLYFWLAADAPAPVSECKEKPNPKILIQPPAEVSLLKKHTVVTPQSIGIVGVPADLGGNRRGTDMGPSALRYARLAWHLEALGHSVRDYGNLDIPVPETRPPGEPTRRYFAEIVTIWQQLAEVTGEICRGGGIPLVLGGDHSMSIGTLTGVAQVHGPPGLLWIDAHADMNDPATTPSGNIHGMSLAAAIGETTADIKAAIPAPLPIAPERAVLIGARDLDAPEKDKVRNSDLTVFTMKDIDELGIATVVRRAWAIATQDGRGSLHVSFDVDVMDPALAGGVGTPVPGGLTYREAHLMMELLAELGHIGAVEITEVNPILDIRNQTAELAVDLATSLFGKRIL